MKGAALVLLALVITGTSSCWVSQSVPDRDETSDVEVPTGEMRRTYYAGENILRTEMRVLVYANGRVVRQGIFREYYPDGSLKLEHH